MLEPNEQRLTDAATAVVRSLPAGEVHTVAAAVMDLNGAIHTGVNVFHFTGGPCAELVAVGTAAAAGAVPLITIVAVGDGDRGVIPPCGRCRQILLDLHPDIYVIMPVGPGLESRPVRELLPDGYTPQDCPDRPRIVYFHPRHYDSIISGRKTVTVRFCDPLRTGPATLVFDDGDSIRHLDAIIDQVSHCLAGDLTDDDAHRGDLADRHVLRAALADPYPGLQDCDPVDVVTFRLREHQPIGNPGTAP